MQYTIRRIPRAVDDAIRERARLTRKSLNEAVVDTLVDGAGVKGVAPQRRDLSDIAGSWKNDKIVEAVITGREIPIDPEPRP